MESESIPAASVQGLSSTLSASAIGCVCRTEAVLGAAITTVLDAGVPTPSVHVGALDGTAAQSVAKRFGVAADLHADDPLQGLVALPGDDAPRANVDRGGVLGCIVGALAGCAIALTPVGRYVAAPAGMLVLANAALYLVIGGIVGSVLGAALAPQSSTHAGFRLIDGMHEGGYALVALVEHARHDELQRLLESVGAVGITKV